jgi:5,10-methylene-tetrahydrofolate dehydrogenase/methenyl tetrahydrofolate cyclohydrolase
VPDVVGGWVARFATAARCQKLDLLRRHLGNYGCPSMPATIGALLVTGKLEGKVAIVAGGSAGVGKGVSAMFAREGAHVAVLARGGQRLSEAVSEIGHGAVGIVVDISSPDSVRAAFAEAVADTMLYVVTRTRHEMIDVIHVRAAS